MNAFTVTAVALTFSFTALVSGSAFAGPYADDLGKCLVRSTSDEAKTSFVKWMFAAAALHPAVKPIASVSDAQRRELNKSTAALFERLLTQACRSEAQQALKYEGPGTIGAAFQVLGQVAARGLFSDPTVAGGIADVEKYFDAEKMKAVFGSSLSAK